MKRDGSKLTPTRFSGKKPGSRRLGEDADLMDYERRNTNLGGRDVPEATNPFSKIIDMAKDGIPGGKKQ